MDEEYDMSGFYSDPWAADTSYNDLSFGDYSLASNPDYGSFDFSSLFGSGDSGGMDYNSLFGLGDTYTPTNYDFGTYDYGTSASPTDYNIGSSDYGLGSNQSLNANDGSLAGYMGGGQSLSSTPTSTSVESAVQGIPTVDPVIAAKANDYTGAYSQNSALPSDSGMGVRGGVLMDTSNAGANGSGIGGFGAYQLPGGLTVYTLDGNIIGTGATSATDGQGLMASGAPTKPNSLSGVDLLSSDGSFDNQGLPWAQYASQNGYTTVPNQAGVLGNSSLGAAGALAASGANKATGASGGSSGGGGSQPKQEAKTPLQQGLSNAALVAQLLNALGMKGVKPPAPADSKGTTAMSWNRINSPLQSVAKG